MSTYRVGAMDSDKPEQDDGTVTVVNVYATPWRFNGTLEPDEGAPTDLAGMEKLYELYREQLPRLLPQRVLGDGVDMASVELAAQVGGVRINNAGAELYALPSNQVVLSVTMCLANGVLTSERRAQPVANVLEQCITGEITIGGYAPDEALRRLLDGHDTFHLETPGDPLLPERHQLVFVRPVEEIGVPDEAVIDKILYRKTP